MRITKLTDYAFILLAEMEEGVIVSSKSLSDKTKVPFATVNKLLRLLVQGGFCSSRGGKAGGFILEKPHSKISLVDVISCIEGLEQHFTECSNPGKNCQCLLKTKCKISNKIKLIDNEIYTLLKNKFISDLI